MERSAGIAIIYRGKVLMTHAPKAPWYRSWMPPKGKIEPGETEEEAACREVEEECGISVDLLLLGKKHTVPYFRGEKGKKHKEAYIFECRVDSLDELGVPKIIGGEIPTYMLQEGEIDRAIFMTREECQSRALPRYLPMLDEIFSTL